jgi:hypothetical protein
MIRYIIFSALVFLTVGAVCAQDVHYNYDNNGNRTSQEIIILKTVSSNEFGISSIDTINRKILIDEASLVITIFPNPVKSLLNIEIDGEIPVGVRQIEICSVNGTSIYYNESVDAQTRIDFKSFKPGIYFLTITIGDAIDTWKIIKQ